MSKVSIDALQPDTKTIILDDILVSSEIEQLISREKNCKLITCFSGYEILEIAQASSPILCMFDFWQPDMNGDEILNALRTHRSKDDTTIVLLSDELPQATVDRLIAQGCDKIIPSSESTDEKIHWILKFLHLPQRKSFRGKIDRPITIHHNNSSIPGTAVDISGGGIRIVCESAIQAKSKVSLEIILPGMDHAIKIKCQVVRCIHTENNYILGLMYLDLHTDLSLQLSLLSERGQKIQNSLEQEQLLPAISSVVQRVLSISMHETADFDALSDLIHQDQSLTATVLRYANSPFFGFQVPVTTVKHAVSLLGIKGIRNAILALAVFNSMSLADTFFDEPLKLSWHALAVGYLSQTIAQMSSVIDPQEAYIAGILHDIGKLFLVKLFGNDYKELMIQGLNRGIDRPHAEREAFFLDHSEIGAQLLTRWNIPQLLVDATRTHHSSPLEVSSMKGVLATANHIAHFLTGKKAPPVETIEPVAGLSAEDIHVMLVETSQWIQDLFVDFSSMGNENEHNELVAHATSRLLKRLDNLNDLYRRYRRAYIDMRDRQTKISRSNRLIALGKLSYGLSHHVNNPLATLKSNIEYIQSELTDGNYIPSKEENGEIKQSKTVDFNEIDSALSDSMEAVQIISNVVRSLSDFVSINPEDSQTIELRELCEQSVELVRISSHKNTSWEIKIPEKIFISGDRTRLLRAFSEVLKNSVQAIYTSGTIQILGYKDSIWATIEVIDNGHGIPSDMMEHVCEPFYTTRMVGEGTGLGLTTALGTFIAHGGAMTIESKPQQGTRVTIRIPISTIETKH